MSHQPGADCGGIRSLEDLQLRCYVNPDTGCWHWRNAFRVTTGGKRVPATYLPALKGTVSAMRAAVLLSRGFDSLKPEHCVWADCLRRDCCNPSHMRIGSRGQMAAHMIKHGAGRTKASYIAGSIKIARGRSRFTLKQIEEMRASGMKAKELADRYGMSISHACRILNGEQWKVAPVMPGNSVFSWRPA